MNQDIITFELDDNGQKKTFLITQLKGFDFINMLFMILKQIINTKVIDAKVAKQYLLNWSQSGVKVENISNADINKFNSIDNFDVIFDVLTSVISNIPEDEQYKIYSKLISCVSIVNGAAGNIRLDAVKGSPNNVEIYINNNFKIMELLAKVIQVHIQSVNKKKDQQSS